MKSTEERYQTVMSHKHVGWTAHFDPNNTGLYDMCWSPSTAINQSSCLTRSLTSTMQTIENTSDRRNSSPSTFLCKLRDGSSGSLCEVSDPSTSHRSRISFSQSYAQPIVVRSAYMSEDSYGKRRMLTLDKGSRQYDRVLTLRQKPPDTPRPAKPAEEIAKVANAQFERHPVILEKYEQEQEKPPDIVIEKWLPYKERPPRRIVEVKYKPSHERTAKLTVEKRKVHVEREVCIEKVASVDPTVYTSNAGDCLSHDDLKRKLDDLGISDLLDKAAGTAKAKTCLDQYDRASKVTAGETLRHSSPARPSIKVYSLKGKGNVRSVRVIEVKNNKDLGKALIRVLRKDKLTAVHKNPGSQPVNQKTT